LIVLWRLCAVRPLLPYEQVLIAALTVGLAAVLSAWVETPMRAGAHRMGNGPALAGLLTATAVVAALGAAVVADGGAAWRLRAPAREAYAALSAAVAERPRCRDDRQLLGVSVPVCHWSPQTPGTDFIIWGDSHARALSPELASVLSEGGRKSGLSIGVPGCPPLAGIELVGRSYSDRCPIIVDAVFKAIMRDRPRLVVVSARWANFASDVRAPGDGARSGRLLDRENDRAPIQLADALIRTVERARAAGAQVVIVGPVPEIDYDPPKTLVRSLHGIGPLPEVRRADFNLRQRQVLSALERVQAMESVLVVYPHSVLCNDATCAVAEGIQSLYEDDDHLSPFGAARVSAAIATALGLAGVGLAKSDAILKPNSRD
jgi:hypothetical protein